MGAARYLPPAVRYPLAFPRGPLWVAAGLWVLAAALLLAWQWVGGAVPWAVRLGGWLSWVLAGWAIQQGARGVAQGQLFWDGGAWWWQAPGAPEWQAVQQLRLRMDAQSALLLAWRSECGLQYGWLEQDAEPWRWGDCRRAVYSAATVSGTAPDRA